MSTLQVVNLQNPGSGIINATLNSTGTTTFNGQVTFAPTQLFPTSNGTSPPPSPVLGSLWYDTSTTPAILKVYNGTTFVPVVNPPVVAVTQIIAGTGISVSPAGGTGAVTVTNSGVTQLVAGTNITLTPSGGTGVVTIDATPGAGGVSQIVAGAGIAISPGTGVGAVTICGAAATPTTIGSIFGCTDQTSTNATVSFGLNAGLAGFTGVGNVAIGYDAMCCGSSGNFNVAIGCDAMGGAGPISAGNVIAIGRFSGFNTTSGGGNVFIGNSSGCAVTTGSQNVAIGGGAALNSLTTGIGNIAIGQSAGCGISLGANCNIAIGALAHIGPNSTGCANLSLGNNIFTCPLTGNNNVAIGDQAMRGICNPVTASDNIAIGQFSGYNLSTGGSNTLVGICSGCALLIGCNNVAVGRSAASNMFGPSDCNVAVGYFALNSNQNGDNNIAIGQKAAQGMTSGSNNTVIGPVFLSGAHNNEVWIGQSAGYACFANAGGTWNWSSDGRDKKDIEDLPVSLPIVDDLRPVKYQWNMRDQQEVENYVGTKTVGFIAQEVLETFKKHNVTSYVEDVVTYTDWKDQYTLGKEGLIPFLTKAIQELHAKVNALEAEVASLKK